MKEPVHLTARRTILGAAAAQSGHTISGDDSEIGRQLLDPDEELLRSLRAGTASAFEILQRRYSRRLFKQIIAITQNREDAEDALQDTFLQAFRYIQAFEGRSRITTWLTRIAINTALMKVRKRRSRAEVSFERPLDLEEDSPMFELEDLALSPEQVYVHTERLKHVVDAVEQLKPILRVAVIAWFRTDCSMHEAADLLGISVTAVKTRVHRARQKLRDALVPNEDTPRVISANLAPQSRRKSPQDAGHI